MSRQSKIVSSESKKQRALSSQWQFFATAHPATAHLLPAILLLIFVLLLFYPLLFTNRVLASGDILHYFYPHRDYTAAALREGRIPLWDPYIFLGAPFLANPQSAVLYPLHWPLSWLPVTKQIYWSAAIHTWILGMGGYALMRRWKMSTASSFTTALLLAGSGFFGGLIGHINQMNVCAWLPWGMVVIEGLHAPNLSISQPHKKGLGDWCVSIAWIALLVALMLLAGHTQSAYINLFAIGIWTVLRSLQVVTQAGEEKRRWDISLKSVLLRVHPSPLLIFLAGCLLGALIAAAQLLPTLELSALGLRSGGLDYAEASSFSLKPLQILWTLLPSYGLADLGVVFGTLGYTEYVAYVGTIGLMIGIWEFGSWILGDGFTIHNVKSKIQQIEAYRLFALLFVLLGLFLAAGRWNPFYYLLFKLVPGFDLFRAPARWMMLYTLGMAVLVGVGVQRQGDKETRRQGDGVISGSVLVTVLLLVLLAGDLLLAARSLPHTQTTAPQALYDLRTAPAFLLTNPQRQNIDPAATGRFLSMSTITFDPGDMGDYRRILVDSGQVDARGFEQLLIAQKSQEILAPNLPLLWRVPAVDGFDGGVLPLQRYNQFLTILIPPDKLVPDGRLREQIKTMPPTRLLNLLNAQYIVTDKVRDLWFEGVYYDRQIGATLTADQTTVIEASQPFEATHLDLIGFVEGDPATLVQNRTIAEVTIASANHQEQTFPLIAGSQAGAQLAEGTLDSTNAQSSGAIIAYRDVEGGKQEYRVRLSLAAATTPEQLSIRHLSTAPNLVIQAATLFDQRTQMFLPLLPSDRGHFQLVHSGDVKVYENLDSLPRSYLVHQTQSAGSDDEALELLRSQDFDPAQRAIVTGLPALQTEPTATDFAEIVDYQAEHIEIRAGTANPALLVLSDAYYPGWRATVDGVETAIVPTNQLFRGLPIPSGQHTIIFDYDPQSWQRGLQLSLAGSVIWLFLMMAGKMMVGKRWQER